MRNYEALINRPINFKLYAGKILDLAFPKDENGFTNCAVLICWVFGIDKSLLPDKCIDTLCDTLPKLTIPEVDTIIAYKSTTRLNGYTYVPGCCAIISEVKAGFITKVVAIHPMYGQKIVEVPPDIFKDKPVVYLDAR
jgi:hypothetical protein